MNALDTDIQKVLSSSDPELEMSAGVAALLMLLIEREDRSDDDALAAYDLLHSRATFGRAF